MRKKTWKQVVCVGLACWMLAVVALVPVVPGGASGDCYCNVMTQRGPCCDETTND